jgi:hypothetical protein
MDERSSSVDIDGILFIIIIILGKNRNNRRLRERFSFCFLFSSGPFVNWPLSLSLSLMVFVGHFTACLLSQHYCNL